VAGWLVLGAAIAILAPGLAKRMGARLAASEGMRQEA